MAIERLGQLLLFWLSSQGKAHHELVCGQPVDQTSAPAQSAALSASGREKLLSAFLTVGADLFVIASYADSCVCLLAKCTGKPDAGDPRGRFDEGEGNALATLLG